MKKAILWTIALCFLAYSLALMVRGILAQRQRPMPKIEVELAPINYTQESLEDTRAATLEAFFVEREMPLAKYADLFVTAADTYGIDWRLLPAISVRESSGGLQACGFNAFGWDSCNGYNFTSNDEAITYISWRLAESPYYEGKSTYEKLKVYNPPAIVPDYAAEVISIMEAIQETQ